MATGDQNDIQSRLTGLLPRWFGDAPTVVSALMAGFASGLTFIFGLIGYAKLQTRIKTATDSWLDMIATDFFGIAVQREGNQTDASFRSRIIANMFRERATRNGMIRVIEDLTGRTPIICEPAKPSDTGAYGAPNSGYGAAGGYGSLLLPYTCFITAYRQAGTGIPLVAGYGVSTGAYSTPSQAEYASLLASIEGTTDADIYAAIDAVKPVATQVWVRLSS